MWQWANWLHTTAAPTKRVVCLNMDETSVKLYQDSGRGFTVVNQRLRLTKGPYTQNVSRAELRATMTHAAIICSDPEIQKVLPQVLFAKKSTMSLRQASEIRASLPPYMVLHHGPSSWMTGPKMQWLISEIKRAVSPWCHNTEFIFMVDAYKAHLTTQALQAVARAGFKILLIPAKCTWLLQPADTHLFAVYKRRLAQVAQEWLVESSTTSLTWPSLARCLATVVADVIHGRSWYKSFQDAGLVGHQGGVSKKVWEALQVPVPFEAPHAMPSLRQLQAVLPRRVDVDVGLLFGFFETGAGTCASTRERRS